MWQKKKVGGEEVQDKTLGEIQELMDSTPEELAEDGLVEMSASTPGTDEEEGARDPRQCQETN